MRQIAEFYLSRLTSAQRLVLGLMVLGLIVVALMEMLVVASITAFATLIATMGESLDSVLPEPLRKIAASFLSGDYRQAVLLFGFASVAVLTAKNGVQAVNLFFQTRLAMRAEAALGHELLIGYAQAPYLMVQANSVDDIAQNVRWRSYYGRNLLTGVISVVANGTISIFLVGYLLLSTPVIAVTVILGLVLIAFAIGRLLKTPVDAIARRYLEGDRALNRKSAAFVAGLRQIRVSGGERRFAGEFDAMAGRFADTFAFHQLALRASPWLMETVGLGVLMSVVVGAVYARGGVDAELTGVAALIVVTAWRLLRAMVEMQRALAKVRTALPFVTELIDEVAWLTAHRELGESPGRAEPLEGVEGIVLDDVCFRYPGTDSDALSQVDLKIEKGHSIGVIGRSGQGKSTLADLIMGLFPPDSGRVLVGGVELEGDVRPHWRHRVGYLCQKPYLLDASLLQNIAFGEAPEAIDLQKARRCAHLAQVDFLTADDTGGQLNCVVDATRLSGGQQLRIAIARAIYKARDLLILDEPTSALDHASGKLLQEVLERLKAEYAMLIVSHDLELLTLCDQLVWLEKGRVRAKGEPQQVIALFRESAAELVAEQQGLVPDVSMAQK